MVELLAGQFNDLQASVHSNNTVGRLISHVQKSQASQRHTDCHKSIDENLTEQAWRLQLHQLGLQ